MIYFLQSEGDLGQIKIGYTENLQTLERRIDQLATGNPYELHLIAFMPIGTREVEMYLHELFKRYRTSRSRKEWFYPGPVLIDFIVDVRTLAIEEYTAKWELPIVVEDVHLELARQLIQTMIDVKTAEVRQSKRGRITYE
jgi:hypothetical protein